MDTVESHVDIVDAIITWYKTNRVDILVDSRDETIVLSSRRGHNLEIIIAILEYFDLIKLHTHNTLASKSPLAPFLRTIKACGLLTAQPASGNWPISILWASP